MYKKLIATWVLLLALVCHAAPPKPMVTFTVDASKAPEKKEWAEKELKPALEGYAKNVIELLDGKGTKWTRGDIPRILETKDGVAWASGDKIYLSLKFVERNPKEVKGALVHEFAHVIQDYRPAPGRAEPYARAPGWLVEGIADWVRWVNYEGKAGAQSVDDMARGDPRHDASYRVSASFLAFVSRKYDRTFVMKLNKICREGKYDEEVWKKLTKKTREQLAEEWKRWLQKK